MSRFLRKAGGPRSGFSILEVCISASLLIVLTGALVAQLDATRRQSLEVRTSERLQTAGDAALREIGEELRKSGFVYANGKQYPSLWIDGSPGTGFQAYSHVRAAEHDTSGQPGFGYNRELAYALPVMRRIGQAASGINHCLDCSSSELDPGGMYEPPPLNATAYLRIYQAPYISPASGKVVWAAQDGAFVLVTESSGRNALQQRRGTTVVRTLARDVERLVFDTSSTDPVGVPVGTVRVRLWLRAKDQNGAVQRWQGESMVDMRNE